MKQIGFASISPNLSYACKFDLSSWIHTALGDLKDSLFLSSSVSSTSPRFPRSVMSGWRTPCRLTVPARCLSSTSASPVGSCRREARTWVLQPCSVQELRHQHPTHRSCCREHPVTARPCCQSFPGPGAMPSQPGSPEPQAHACL